jgi:hypothetical protein
MLVGFIVGCGSSASKEDYVPSADAGRQAIENALSAWQSGKPIGNIEGQGSSAVHPQDSDWKSGKKLASFSIEKEIPTTEGPKQFAVKLTYQGEPKPVDTVYYVVGRDPVWVFRDRDYKKTTGM